MPEGHIIHRAARDQGRLLAGAVVHASSPQGRFRDGATMLDGSVLTGIDAHGKHLFYRFNDAVNLHVHLGLFGRFVLHRGGDAPEPRGALRLRMAGHAGTVDLRGPTTCEILDADDEVSLMARLGPDPLRADADHEVVWRRISRSRAAIGTLLMDQSVLAGVGNVYRAGVKSDRIVTVDPADSGVPRSRLRRGERTYVYEQARCRRCGGTVEHWGMGGRTAWACPVYQR